MMKIKGVNVFPAQIEEILKEFPEVSSEYQIRISHLEGKDTMRIYVETNGTVDFLDLAKRIASKVKSRIGFTACKSSRDRLVASKREKDQTCHRRTLRIII